MAEHDMTFTDQKIIEALSRGLGEYFAAHPEARKAIIRFYSEGDGLLSDFHFSNRNAKLPEAEFSARQDRGRRQPPAQRRRDRAFRRGADAPGLAFRRLRRRRSVDATRRPRRSVVAIAAQIALAVLGVRR
jgi:hypothetical protein